MAKAPNPQNLEAQRIVNKLHSEGRSYSEIGRLLGRDSSLISQIARKGNKGASLVPALSQIEKSGKLSPANLPERRTTKAGTVAKVRGGTPKLTPKPAPKPAPRPKPPEQRARYIQHAKKEGKIVRTRINARTDASFQKQVDRVPDTSHIMIKLYLKNGSVIIAKGHDHGNMKKAGDFQSSLKQYLASGQPWGQAMRNAMMDNFDMIQENPDGSYEDVSVIPDENEISNYIMYIVY
jgi:ribosomal protein S30